MNQEKQGYKLVNISFSKNLEIPQEWEIKKIEDLSFFFYLFPIKMIS